ncbi:Uncharacterized protein TCM_015809 [Theobroma cacao]|uniref:Uncharacterized protein n=1 Tax=Theobroma cacao TaxID=3641 RepID=A0A061GAQ9_THECC|nr:Uncharacterized protein TCM_015809 [Theobroma cacao]
MQTIFPNRPGPGSNKMFNWESWPSKVNIVVSHSNPWPLLVHIPIQTESLDCKSFPILSHTGFPSGFELWSSRCKPKPIVLLRPEDLAGYDRHLKLAQTGNKFSQYFHRIQMLCS